MRTTSRLFSEPARQMRTTGILASEPSRHAGGVRRRDESREEFRGRMDERYANQPGTTPTAVAPNRRDNILNARADGTFDAKVAAYNKAGQATGHSMDAAGNITAPPTAVKPTGRLIPGSSPGSSIWQPDAPPSATPASSTQPGQPPSAALPSTPAVAASPAAPQTRDQAAQSAKNNMVAKMGQAKGRSQAEAETWAAGMPGATASKPFSSMAPGGRNLVAEEQRSNPGLGQRLQSRIASGQPLPTNSPQGPAAKALADFNATNPNVVTGKEGVAQTEALAGQRRGQIAAAQNTLKTQRAAQAPAVATAPTAQPTPREAGAALIKQVTPDQWNQAATKPESDSDIEAAAAAEFEARKGDFVKFAEGAAKVADTGLNIAGDVVKGVGAIGGAINRGIPALISGAAGKMETTAQAVADAGKKWAAGMKGSDVLGPNEQKIYNRNNPPPPPKKYTPTYSGGANPPMPRSAQTAPPPQKAVPPRPISLAANTSPGFVTPPKNPIGTPIASPFKKNTSTPPPTMAVVPGQGTRAGNSAQPIDSETLASKPVGSGKRAAGY